MEYLNHKLENLFSQEFGSSTLKEIGAWVCCMRYCSKVENGGTIVGFMEWREVAVKNLLNVPKNFLVKNQGILWEILQNDLKLKFYPIDQENETKRLRKIGRMGGEANAKRFQGDPNSDVPCNEYVAISQKEADALPLEKQMPSQKLEQKGNGKEKNNGGYPPLTPNNHHSDKLNESSYEEPSESEILKAADEYPGDMARGIAPKIRHSWARDWYGNLLGKHEGFIRWRKRFYLKWTNDVLSKHPKAVGEDFIQNNYTPPQAGKRQGDRRERKRVLLLQWIEHPCNEGSTACSSSYEPTNAEKAEFKAITAELRELGWNGSWPTKRELE